MSDHDPLCAQKLDGFRERCTCRIIARVRAEEVERASVVIANLTTERDKAYAKGRADALAEARDAVAALTSFVFAYQTWVSGDYGYDEGPWVKKENALAAIDALRGDA